MYLITEVLSPSTADTLSPWEHMAALIRGRDRGTPTFMVLTWALELTESGSLIFQAPMTPWFVLPPITTPYYGGYGRFGGTSGATPHVAGIAPHAKQSFKVMRKLKLPWLKMPARTMLRAKSPTKPTVTRKVRGAMIPSASIPHTLPSPIALIFTRQQLRTHVVDHCGGWG